MTADYVWKIPEVETQAPTTITWNIPDIKSHYPNLLSDMEFKSRSVDTFQWNEPTSIPAFTWNSPEAVKAGNELADKAIGASGDITFSSIIGEGYALALKPFIKMVSNIIMNIVNYLNMYSVEIITVSIMGLASAMMVTSLWRHDSGKWLGRILLVGLVGTMWRMMIA